MTVSLIVAPAASGKTAHLISRVSALSRDLALSPRVVVPSTTQVRAWQRRLAKAGGALGARISTFNQLHREILNMAGQAYVELSDPVQFRLLRLIVDEAKLVHFRPLREKPGFVQVLQELIAELKAGGIFPEDFADAIEGLGAEPRLRELAQIYTEYQSRLRAERWADTAGLSWLAAEALRSAPDIGCNWPFLAVDGFDDLTPIQIKILDVLASRVGDMIITLSGETERPTRPLAHKRFIRTQAKLTDHLKVKAQPLSRSYAPKDRELTEPGEHRDRLTGTHPALRHLEAGLFQNHVTKYPAHEAIDLIAAPNREGEVRAALRWLKARMIQDHMQAEDLALLVRSLAPYASFIQQVASEFGLPIHILNGSPLRDNPVIAALQDLLHLSSPEDGFSWRLTIEVWRSPYFDWSISGIHITRQDAETMRAVARWGRVVAGQAQWREVLSTLATHAPEPHDDEEREIPDEVPTGETARDLSNKFNRFVKRVTPPEGAHTCRDFVAWIEDLVGDPEDDGNDDLGVIQQVLNGPRDLIERDLAALQALKDVLRGLVWAEAAVVCTPTVFSDFLAELDGALEAAFYQVPQPEQKERLLVASVTQARGVSFRAVAVLGLAEGEFPTTIAEDAFLRDGDREQLQKRFQLPLALSTDSAEAEYFYEAVTRARERLFLSRPRIADNGAPWAASPFWEEIQRLTDAEPITLTSDSPLTLEDAASWTELLTAASTQSLASPVWGQIAERIPARHHALKTASHILALRTHPVTDDFSPGPFDGDLSHLRHTFTKHFGPRHSWSTSRLEAYHTCPFMFFVSSVLRLEPPIEPAEGLDVRQLGNIYHHLFEAVYKEADDPDDLTQLLTVLPEVAAKILDEAPEREQFRATAWWAQTRQEIITNVQRSLEALSEAAGDFTPFGYEAKFGIEGTPPLIVRSNGDSLRLRGYIDRVDRAPDGRLRIIDYKTGGPFAFTAQALKEGKKLQLPLYALAARDALGLGEPVEGFYWHVRHAEASRLSLAKFGPQAAMDIAVAHAWDVAHGARGGDFVPHPPRGGCPSYCPAAGFCWRYQPGW